MEEWQQILEGRYRNVKVFGEYIGLELLNDPDCGHPFNHPCSLDDKLEAAGYTIRKHDRQTLSDGCNRYIRVEFWKKGYAEKAKILEMIENNIRAFERRNSRGINESFADTPLITERMAAFLLVEYSKLIDELQFNIDLIKKRLDEDFYPKSFDIPKPHWEKD